MKYGEQLTLAQAFAFKLSQSIDKSLLPDYIIPMPLHPSKLRERGFNQSQLLAAGISRSLGVELLPESCKRVRNTPPQTGLPWKERKLNMHNAFSCDIDFTGKRIALVDDVLTTGASLNALAKAVKLQGAVQVDAWVVARTVPR
jgi:ComF family protein